MSIKRMSMVWSNSQHKGNALMLLLALADHADDDGFCWPGVDSLATKTRTSRSTVMRLTKQLEESGELIVRRSRRYGNQYIVTVGMDDDEIADVTNARFGSVKMKQQKCQNETTEVSKPDTSEVSHVTQESSYNHHNNTIDAGASILASEQDAKCNLSPGDTVKFDTEQALKLQKRLIDNAKAKGRRGPRQFPSLEMKRKFIRAASELEGDFDLALTRAFEQGRTSVTSAVNYLAAWAKNKRGNAQPKVIKIGQ